MDGISIPAIIGSNQPPVARAKNITVTLPRSIVALNGSLSTDDAGIVEWKWTPFDNVPACIVSSSLLRFNRFKVFSVFSLRWMIQKLSQLYF